MLRFAAGISKVRCLCVMNGITPNEMVCSARSRWSKRGGSVVDFLASERRASFVFVGKSRGLVVCFGGGSEGVGDWAFLFPCRSHPVLAKGRRCF